MIWGDIAHRINGENVLGGVAYENKYCLLDYQIKSRYMHILFMCLWQFELSLRIAVSMKTATRHTWEGIFHMSKVLFWRLMSGYPPTHDTRGVRVCVCGEGGRGDAPD